jgi:ADP-ribosylglycohydrolase
MTKLGNVLKGVAIGDSWGDKNEFVMSIERLTDNGKNPMGPELPKNLHVTDDTQMSLFLATALEAARGQDMAMTKEVIQQSYLNYYNDRLANDGTRAPGGTVMGSLYRLNQGLSWQEATNPGSDGSGTVMRTSPCAFLPDDGEWVGITAFAAAVTHGHPNAIAAAILNVALLKELLRGDLQFGNLTERALTLAQDAHRYGLTDVGEDKWLEGYEVPGGLQSGFDFMVKILVKAIKHLPALKADPWAMTSDPSREPIVANGGWRAPFTLTIALLSIDMLADDPWLALRRSVTTEGDSDTIGSVAGALIGAGGFEWDDVDVLPRLEPEYQSWINEAEDYFSEVVVS